MNIDSNVSFCADFKPIVRLNKSRWNEIIPEFNEATINYKKEGNLFLIQTENSGKTKYYFAIKKKENNEFWEEDSVCVSPEVIGKWLASLDNKEIALRLQKIFGILNIRRQAIYDLRKLAGKCELEMENIADRYLRRMWKISQNDPDIIVPKDLVYRGGKGVWISQMEAKREIYELKDGSVGRRIIATV